MITFTKHDDYYLFSNNPETRVYLGSVKPEDYIWDEEQQALRTASCGYFNKVTGEKAVEPKCDLEDDSEYDWQFYEEHEYQCTYDFIRRAHCAYLGSSKKNVRFISADKAMERLAWIYYLDQTPEEYDARQEQYKVEAEERKRRSPAMHNLMMVAGETYHVDDNGKRITFEEHIALMKEQLGEDCFDVAHQRMQEENPEIMKLAEEVAKELAKAVNSSYLGEIP
jgi:hypothetical protein